jgi:hypothetical protein
MQCNVSRFSLRQYLAPSFKTRIEHSKCVYRECVPPQPHVRVRSNSAIPPPTPSPLAAPTAASGEAAPSSPRLRTRPEPRPGLSPGARTSVGFTAFRHAGANGKYRPIKKPSRILAIKPGNSRPRAF